MLKEEYFTFNGKTYQKGTVIWYKKDNKITKSIFMWRYTDNNRYLVINVGSSTIPGHLPRSVLLPRQFFDGILRIDNPSPNDLQKVKELELDFARQNKKDDSVSAFFKILALVVCSVLFPPIGLIAMFYAFTRKK